MWICLSFGISPVLPTSRLKSLKFAVIGAYHILDTFAFSAPGNHREATFGEPPQSLPLFPELCPSPHSCPHLLLREFSPHSLLGGQWTIAIAD